MIKFGEDLIIHQLLSSEKYHQKQVCLPRFTPDNWWECDLAMVSKAGYLSEFEVKVSRQDYLKDFEKTQDFYPKWPQPKTTVRKHDLIPLGTCPKFFWFVMPMGMVAVEEVPEYAGLIYIERAYRPRTDRPYLRARTARPAPALPAKKLKAATIERMFRSAYFRFVDQYMTHQRQRLQEMLDDEPSRPADG